MLTKTIYSFKWASFALLFVISTSIPLLLQAIPAAAIECDGTLTTEDCLHVTVGPVLTGNYRTATAAIGMFPQQSTETVTLNIPNCTVGSPTIIRATLYWALRDFDDNTYWDQSVDIARDAGTPATVTSDRRYKSQPDAGASSSYVADITTDGIVTTGSHTYDISNLTTSPGAVNPNTSQWGFGIHAIYECPEFPVRTIVQKEGHDVHWRGWTDPWSQDRSELVCETFTASTSARSATLEFFLPGSADPPTRQADIWYKTGTGTAPTPTEYNLLSDVNTPTSGGIVLDREVFTGEPELEVYTSPTITIPAGDEYLCMQTDSSFNTGQHPDNAGISGASMVLGAGWFIYDSPAPNTLSLGDLVWNDVNNNGIVDGTETGICNVDVTLYSDVNNDNQYTIADDGSTPLQTDTTNCGGANDGTYLFTGLTAGNYCVVIPQLEFNSGGPLEGFVTSTGVNGVATGSYELAPDPDNNTDDDDNGSSTTNGVVACGVTLALTTEPINDGDTDADTNLSVDFGLFEQACLGDFVWYDTNGNGLQDSGEGGVAGVTTTLHNATDNNTVTSMVTDSNGAYMFCNLVPGSYYVVFTNLPANYSLVSVDGGSDDARDSDINQTTARTPTYTLAAGDVNTTVDGGIVSGASTTTTPPSTLANTGLETLQLAIIGLLAVNVPILIAKSSVSKYKRQINRF